MLGEGNISLSKVMTPVQDYDSNSLKRRESLTNDLSQGTALVMQQGWGKSGNL